MFVMPAFAHEILDNAQKLVEEGLQADAYHLLRPALLDPENGNEDSLLDSGLGIAVMALQILNRTEEIDEFLESVAEVQKNSWRALTSIAKQYHSIPGNGFVIDNQFRRGHGGGRIRGQWINVADRDRIRALQLLNEAMPLAQSEVDQQDTARLYQTLADVLIQQPGGMGWRMQILTDISALPDYNTMGFYDGSSSSGAPVDAEGNPVVYRVPESWESAQNDGQRWRWALEQAVKVAPALQNEVWRLQAEFYQSQFGEQTLREFDFFRRTGQEPETTASILSLETLTDDETIAKLAGGIKRFAMPSEFNYIRLFQKIDDVPALSQLAEIAKNRRQYVKAAEYYGEIIERLADDKGQQEFFQRQLDQITGNWGRFEQSGSDVSGLRADLRYLFRNGNKVNLTVQEIDVVRLLADVKEYIKSRPNPVDWQRLNIDHYAQQILLGDDEQAEARQKYVGDVLKTWAMELTPAENHFDRSATIRFENETAGAFLIRAEIAGSDGKPGNVEYAVVWLHDTAIVRRTIDGASLYFVSEAESGTPIAGANVEVFGYFTEYQSLPAENNRRRQEPTLTWNFRESAHSTDENGFAVVAGESGQSNRFNTLITATVPGRKGIAHIGFANLWTGPLFDRGHNAMNRVFVITDRPVYRPLDTANFKVWVGNARFDMPNLNEWAGQSVTYTIYEPRGEKLVEKNVVLDEYGGMTAELELPKNAMLGTYRIAIASFIPSRTQGRGGAITQIGGGTFRVEEYRTPEYEVVIEAPKEPASLGDIITATIRANYYFGSPVSEATVKYKVIRERAITDWFPIRPWDWLFGNGYAWFAYDAEWLPGWARWGIRRPTPPWVGPGFGRFSGPPEVVAEAEVPINPDGTLSVEINTAIAKEMFPNDSQRYSITAEVIDNSRRTIVGTGMVLVAKEPFRVFSWVDRGFYAPNQKIAARFQTRRLDGKPVSGEGLVRLLQLTYEDSGKPTTEDRPQTAGHIAVIETEVHSARVVFDGNGRANIDLTAAAPGQYRISCVIDGQEGGYVFNVYGDTVADSSWKFNALELIPDREEYTPGDNVVLRVNTNRDDSTVLLFVRPVGGVAAGRPQVLRLEGRSAEISIPVIQNDMPNFFVEALTVSGGRVVNDIREIVVPPQHRVVNVDIRPDSETYKPGGKMKADLIVTDLDGKPVVGQIAVTIYDKAVEYISGGSNVSDIREFFWKWRRNHRPQFMTNLSRAWNRLFDYNKPGMENLGLFGHIALPGVEDAVYANGMVGGNFGGAMPRRAMGQIAMNDAAVPVSESSPLASSPALVSMEVGSSAAPGPFADTAVRTNFADTAFWAGALETNEEGIAQIEIEMPESLTTWKINVWTMAPGTRVGAGTAEVITRKDFIIRMQTPRFLIEKDKAVFSANVHNYLTDEKESQVSLTVSPATRLRFADETANVRVPANGEVRVDWVVEAVDAGGAVITMKALTDEESDAMQKTLPVLVHGMLKQDSYSAFISPAETSASFDVRVPEERRPEQTKLTVQFSPSLASSMIDALPYLVDYPYGSTEQTLNRFLPTVIVRKVIGELDVQPAEHVAGDAPGQRNDWAIARSRSPVFDQEQIDEMVSDGVARLANMQYPDGGWGWFSGRGGSSSAHLTALIVRGLNLAQANGVFVPDDGIVRGVNWLKRYQDNQITLLKNAAIPDRAENNLHRKEQADETDAFVFMVLAEVNRPAGESANTIDAPTADMLEFLQRDRGKLSLYGVSMVGMAESLLPSEQDITPYIRIIEQYLVQDEANQTAYLNLRGFPGWRWWAWYGSEFETQAYYLRLLMRTDPKSPVAPRLVKYLLNNRKHATYWNSTRDTAIVIEALAEYLTATGEGKPNMTVEILINDEVKKTAALTSEQGSPEHFLLADSALVLEADEVASGIHKIELRVIRHPQPQWGSPLLADSPLYITAFLENFTLEDPIEKAGLEVNIERRIYKLVRDESATATVAGSRGQAVDLHVEKYVRELVNESRERSNAQRPDPVTALRSVPGFQSGDLIEIELIIESRNDYESLIIEDWKAAGLEPVDLRSGYNGNELGAFVEFRDERVVFFVYRLARGKHSVTYRLRAEIPGEFSALPARIEAMYAPELKGNSDEDKVKVEEW